MNTFDAYIIYEEKRYDLVYRSSVFWMLDDEGYNYFKHSVNEENIINVVISHINTVRDENPSIYEQLKDFLKGFVDDYSYLITPEIFLGNFGTFVIVGEDRDVSMDNIDKVGKYYIFNINSGGKLYIAKKCLSDFGMCDLLRKNLSEDLMQLIEYDTNKVDIFMIADDYKDMINQLRDLIGKMNEVYERNGEQQIIIID